jgi:hypothetical protein
MVFSVNETIIEPTTNATEKAEKESHIETALGIMECYFDISSPASCEKNVLKPFAYYTRLGVYYSREWYKKIYNKYFAQLKQWKTMATSFVTEFTHHDLSCKKGCNYFAFAKKALKSWKSVLSGSSSLLGGFNFSSAGLSFASGVVASTKLNVTEMLVSLQLFKMNIQLMLIPYPASKRSSTSPTTLKRLCAALPAL